MGGEYLLFGDDRNGGEVVTGGAKLRSFDCGSGMSFR